MIGVGGINPLLSGRFFPDVAVGFLRVSAFLASTPLSQSARYAVGFVITVYSHCYCGHHSCNSLSVEPSGKIRLCPNRTVEELRKRRSNG